MRSQAHTDEPSGDFGRYNSAAIKVGVEIDHCRLNRNSARIPRGLLERGGNRALRGGGVLQSINYKYLPV